MFRFKIVFLSEGIKTLVLFCVVYKKKKSSGIIDWKVMSSYPSSAGATARYMTDNNYGHGVKESAPSGHSVLQFSCFLFVMAYIVTLLFSPGPGSKEIINSLYFFKRWMDGWIDRYADSTA